MTSKNMKVSPDVCQLRLDFETFSGFLTTTPAGSCSDSFAAAGQTGKDPPTICGTNTDYHSEAVLYLAITIFCKLFISSFLLIELSNKHFEPVLVCCVLRIFGCESTCAADFWLRKHIIKIMRDSYW